MTPISVSYKIDGTASATSDGVARYTINGLFGGAHLSGDVTGGTTFEYYNDQWHVLDLDTPIGWASYTYNTSNPDDITFTGVYDVVGADPDVTFLLGLQGYAAGGTLDYQGSMSLGLPTDVTYTSASGVFLSGAVPEVPEPSSWSMILSGLGLAGLALRQRKGHKAGSPGCGGQATASP